MKENIVQKLTSKDDKYACAFTDRIVAESHDAVLTAVDIPVRIVVTVALMALHTVETVVLIAFTAVDTAVLMPSSSL